MSGLRPLSGEPAELVDLLASWIDGDEPLWVRTSGSTGEPKDVVLSPRAVRASATATHGRLGGAGQWLLAVPVTGVAGLQVVVRSMLAGHRPVTEIDAMTADRRYASLVPTQLHRLLASGDVAPWAELDAILVGGAAVRPDLLEEAGAAGLRIVRTYGMSETCGGCVYDGVPLDGVRVRIDGSGQVEIAGDVLFDGYVGAPRESEWFATADLGEIDGGRLRLLGRVDDVVVSGGVNVPLGAVTAAVVHAPGVADALAVGVPDPEWGERVVVLVVAQRPVDLAVVRDAVESAGHPRSWAPRDAVVVDAIPALASGKPDRLAARTIAARLSGSSRR